MIGFILGPIAKALWKPVAAILGFLGWTWLQRYKGAQAAKSAQAEANVKAVQRGAEGAANAKDNLRNGNTPQQIKDRNDAKWD